ncbi:MAG: hypothetical protein IJ737_02525 [Ruminococcus sp.]|nr:hypothetical protein [Ruminococcus sp.]
MTKKDLIELCKADDDGSAVEKKISEAMHMAGINYFDDAQKRAWRNSLPAAAKVLEKTAGIRY